MSDTPKTDQAKIAAGFQAVPESFLVFARKLERENAALRANLKLLCDTIDAHDIESLSCDRDGHVYCDCLKNNAALARAAIDAARKSVGADAIMRQHLTEGGTPT